MLAQLPTLPSVSAYLEPLRQAAAHTPWRSSPPMTNTRRNNKHPWRHGAGERGQQLAQQLAGKVLRTVQQTVLRTHLPIAEPSSPLLRFARRISELRGWRGMARPVAGLNKNGVRSGGRKPGTPNSVTVEAKVLAAQLVASPVYQARLRRDFERRRLHPSIEALVWNYGHGKPVQPLLHGGAMTLDTSSRLSEERAAFAALDLRELETLAAESQALVDRALMLARMATAACLGPTEPLPTPQDVVVETVTANGPDGFPNEYLGSDNRSSDYLEPRTDPDSTGND